MSRRASTTRLRLLAVLVLVVGGSVFAATVTGLEIPVPAGPDVIVFRGPTPDAPPAAASALVDELTTLAEENLEDLGYPDYDHDHRRVVVNVSSDAGEDLYAQVDVPAGVDVVVRHHAHSVSDFDQMTRLVFEEVDAVHETSVDSVHDRLVVTARWITPGLLRHLARLVGADAVAVRWEPLGGRMRAM